DGAGRRSYLGGALEANAARTVLRDTFNNREIILIDNPSARCNRRISAQSSTDNTPSSSQPNKARRPKGGSKFGRRHGVSFHAARTQVGRRRTHPHHANCQWSHTLRPTGRRVNTSPCATVTFAGDPSIPNAGLRHRTPSGHRPRSDRVAASTNWRTSP